MDKKFSKKNPFCNFCSCRSCTYGDTGDYHAQCEDGKWICSTCFEYDMCLAATNHRGNPCENLECDHRPRLMLPPTFHKYNNEVKSSKKKA